jgi:hypothetical protein
MNYICLGGKLKFLKIILTTFKKVLCFGCGFVCVYICTWICICLTVQTVDRSWLKGFLYICLCQQLFTGSSFLGQWIPWAPSRLPTCLEQLQEGRLCGQKFALRSRRIPHYTNGFTLKWREMGRAAWVTSHSVKKKG